MLADMEALRQMNVLTVLTDPPMCDPHHSLSNSLKLIMVATGEAHIYPRLAPTCEWDTCASHALVLAAGGVVLQHRGGESPECNHMQPLVYNKPHPLNPFFVVYGARK
jgi:3'(2'), 5'-bisphosphate nucleotidase